MQRLNRGMGLSRRSSRTPRRSGGRRCSASRSTWMSDRVSRRGELNACPRPAAPCLGRSFLTRWRNRCTVTNHDGKAAF